MRFFQSASILALTLLLGVLPASASARGHAPTRVPQGFVGMNPGDIFAPGENPQSQLDLMVASGVESLRFDLPWSATEPRPGVYNWAPIDRLVGLAAERHLPIMPTVISAPNWDARHKLYYVPIPARTAPYASFLSTLVRRYGPHGVFWASNRGIPKQPIRTWEIWNEPLFSFNWFVQPFERTYVALLKAAHKAIKRADPGAKVVLAGIPNVAWTVMAQIYKIPGARNSFDVVDIHPYTQSPRGVIVILRRVRQVMNSHGDARKPMIAGELSWASSVGKTSDNYLDIFTNEAGQARKLATALPLLGAHRKELRLSNFYWYLWIANEFRNAQIFNFSGLQAYVNGTIRDKPALAAFQRGALALEQCRQKSSIATHCLRPRR